MKFIVIVWAAFLARVKPVSTMANPACMNITRNPATSVHTKLMATVFAAAAVFAALARESAACGACAVSPRGEATATDNPTPTERFTPFLIRSPIRSPSQRWNDAVVYDVSRITCTNHATLRYYPFV